VVEHKLVKPNELQCVLQESSENIGRFSFVFARNCLKIITIVSFISFLTKMSNCLYVVDLQNYIQNTFHWPLIANLMLTRVVFSRFAKANQAFRSLCFITRSYRVSKHSRQKNHSEGFFLEIWITLRNALGRPLD